jgi:hypothetical protein
MIRMQGPGFLGFQLDRPEGLPDVDTPRTRMVRHAGATAPLPGLDSGEKDALFFSLATTLGRAEYHRTRFDQVIEALNRRREETAAFITYDLFSAYAVFEASDALSAVRSGIDEIVFIAARLRGVSPKDIDKDWKANEVMTSGFDKRADLDIPEVKSLRGRRDWYDELNDYRNVFQHRGWRSHIGAYLPIGSDLPEARSAKHNIMIVPDRQSLVGKSRPNKWTYEDGMRLEHVVERAVEGFRSLLDEVCIGIWGATMLPEGSVPKDLHPNVLIGFVRPALLVVGQEIVLPVFTSADRGRSFQGFPPSAPLHLAEMRAGTKIVAQSAFTFSLAGMKSSPGLPSAATHLFLAIDPPDAGLASVAAGKHVRVPLGVLLANDGIEPLSIPQEAVGSDSLFVWRQPPPI